MKTIFANETKRTEKLMQTDLEMYGRLMLNS
jgi:hypothetical protein